MIFVVGLLDEGKLRGDVDGGAVHLTCDAIAEYRAMLAAGFEPSHDELASMVAYLVRDADAAGKPYRLNVDTATLKRRRLRRHG